MDDVSPVSLLLAPQRNLDDVLIFMVTDEGPKPGPVLSRLSKNPDFKKTLGGRRKKTGGP